MNNIVNAADAIATTVDHTVSVAIRRLGTDVSLPRYAHYSDAGADLYAAQEITLEPGGRGLVGTGVAVAIPDGYAGMVHPRSGLAAEHGVTVLNAPGTVDAGYRGEIRVNLINADPVRPVTVRHGDRIAQLVIQPVMRAEFHEVAELPESARGMAGHGSTGGFTRPESLERTAESGRGKDGE